MCVIWGIPYLMIRVAVRELAPVAMVFLRTGIAAVLLVPLAARRGELRPLIRGWRPLLAYTAIEVALPWYLLGHAETKLTSSLTGLLIAAVPLVGALIVTLSGERARLGLRRWLGLLHRSLRPTGPLRSPPRTWSSPSSASRSSARQRRS